MIKKEDWITPFGPVTIHHREGTADWNNLFSCIRDDEYNIASMDPSTAPVALDIGAHIGGAALAFALRGFQVVAVEPLPENIEILQMNVEANGLTSKILWLERAIYSESEVAIEIHYGNPATESGAVHEFIGSGASSGGRSVHALSITINDVIDRFVDTVPGHSFPPPYVIKIDCEGAEWDALPAISRQYLALCDAIVGELHPRGQDEQHTFDMLSKLAIPTHFVAVDDQDSGLKPIDFRKHHFV